MASVPECCVPRLHAGTGSKVLVAEGVWALSLLSPAVHRALGHGNYRIKAQSEVPGAGPVPADVLSQVWPLQKATYTHSGLSWGQPRPGPWELEAPGLMFASANLKNALVFPFGLGSLQQLPIMVIGPGRGRGSQKAATRLACSLLAGLLSFSPTVSATSGLHFSFSLEFSENMEILVLNLDASTTVFL